MSNHIATSSDMFGEIHTVNLTSEELNTILAALRFWQSSGMADNDNGINNRSDDLDDIATDGGTMDALSINEIDQLCEELNS